MPTIFEGMLLRFRDPEIERAWHVHADDDARLPLRVGLLVFGVLIVLAGLGDEPQGYDGWQDILLIRLLVWGPLLFVGAGLVSLSTLRGRVLDIALSVSLLLTLSLGYVAWFVLPAASAIAYPMYWTVLLLLVHVVAPLGLVRATVAGAAIVAGFFATMLHHGAPSLHFAAHTTFILFAWIQLIAASWLLESRARRAFLAQRRVQARTRGAVSRRVKTLA